MTGLVSTLIFLFQNNMSSIAQTLSELSEARIFNSYLSYQHALSYRWLDDNMPDSFDEWLSELTDEEIADYLCSFLRQIDKRIPNGINWWSESQTFIPNINK